MTRAEKSPITEMEASIVATVSQATFPVGTGPKRFIRDLRSGYIKALSSRGRWYLAFIANRFRRQYELTAEQLQWVTENIGDGHRVKARHEK